jgi:hypothetical protein
MKNNKYTKKEEIQEDRMTGGEAGKGAHHTHGGWLYWLKRVSIHL